MCLINPVQNGKPKKFRLFRNNFLIEITHNLQQNASFMFDQLRLKMFLWTMLSEQITAGWTA